LTDPVEDQQYCSQNLEEVAAGRKLGPSIAELGVGESHPRTGDRNAELVCPLVIRI
jgi:hypothetical protein